MVSFVTPKRLARYSARIELTPWNAPMAIAYIQIRRDDGSAECDTTRQIASPERFGGRACDSVLGCRASRRKFHAKARFTRQRNAANSPGARSPIVLSATPPC